MSAPRDVPLSEVPREFLESQYLASQQHVASLEAEVVRLKDMQARTQVFYENERARAERTEADNAALRGRRFPVHSAGYSVPWALVEPWEAQAQTNHDQSLETLARRGGLDESELWCVMHGKKWRERCSEADAKAWCRALLSSPSPAAGWVRPEVAP